MWRSMQPYRCDGIWVEQVFSFTMFWKKDKSVLRLSYFFRGASSSLKSECPEISLLFGLALIPIHPPTPPGSCPLCTPKIVMSVYLLAIPQLQYEFVRSAPHRVTSTRFNLIPSGVLLKLLREIADACNCKPRPLCLRLAGQWRFNSYCIYCIGITHSTVHAQ